MAVYDSSSPVGVKIPFSEDSNSHTDESITDWMLVEETTGLKEVRKTGGIKKTFLEMKNSLQNFRNLSRAAFWNHAVV